jgi:hypothetical protein
LNLNRSIIDERQCSILLSLQLFLAIKLSCAKAFPLKKSITSDLASRMHWLNSD